MSCAGWDPSIQQFTYGLNYSQHNSSYYCLTYSRVMPGDNGVPEVASTLSATNLAPSPVGNDPAQQRLDLARQLTSVGSSGDGSILSQLTSNPFFTAVCPPIPSSGV